MTDYISYNSGPSLLSPNGREYYLDKEITITWLEPESVDFDIDLIWYEILFTDFYGKFIQPEWIQIAKVPSGNTSFIWQVPEFIKSDKCRIGIRLVDIRGQRSQISFSAYNFSIRERRIPLPAVFEPTESSTYFSYIPIVLDNKGLIGQCSQRAFYQIYYNCESLGIEWSLLFSHVSLSSGPLYWDVSNFVTAIDYSLKVELVDEEIISEPVFIKNITINTLNYFMIDTQAPVGDINIINNREYIKDKDVVIEAYAYDAVSGTKSFRIEQYDIGISDSAQPSPGPYKDIIDFSTWHLQGEDGVKLVQTRFKDWAGNITIENIDEDFLRTYKKLNDNEITAFLINDRDKWIAFGGSFPKLYFNLNEVASLSGEATSMIFYNDILYVAVRGVANRGILQRYSAGQLYDVYSMTAEDSVIISMCEFDDKIFMGLENGNLWSFNGSSFVMENSGSQFNSSITHLGTNGNILYAYFDSSTTALGLRKNIDGTYLFFIVAIE